MIDFDLLIRISNYAKAHLESSRSTYSSRNQNTDKVFHDILNGKIAEFNLYFSLISQGYQLEKPDIQIYDGSNKSYDADLIITAKHGEIFKTPKHQNTYT